RGSSARLKFDIVNQCTQRNISHLHGISYLWSNSLTGNQGLSHLNAFWSDDIGLSSIHIIQQCKTGGSVGIVFNCFNYSRYTVFVSLKINNSKSLLMSTANISGGHLSCAISTA